MRAPLLLAMWWWSRRLALRRIRSDWPAEAHSMRLRRPDGWEDALLKEAYVYLVKRSGPGERDELYRLREMCAAHTQNEMQLVEQLERLREERDNLEAALGTAERLASEAMSGPLTAGAERADVANNRGTSVPAPAVSDFDILRDPRGWLPNTIRLAADRLIARALAAEAALAEATRDGDPDYSPAYQDEYQRLWHHAAAELSRVNAVLKLVDELADSRLREYVCAHDHRWFMQPAFAPNGCPMCNTISFRLIRADSQPEETA